ncbi:MAG: hypothetical protein KJ850_03175 [Gammaproteobacteria bacterium]|nr:hypothetical protein [Gammaproteobacteria bacterium]MBU1624028.1 hypothetical protein [Gammaproteobacteria bacterium]MBU1981756.1 hypothetical protein [Gammaproteobacteria bacterium]
MIAVISCDAGGAEIVSSYVRRQNLTARFVLEGPACKIFERKLGRLEICPLEEAILQSSSILCGSSWKSDIEVDAIRLARLHGKRSIVFIDHWVNYRDRFVRSGETVFPDEIWVGDDMARELAQEALPGLPITLVENPYLLDVREELKGIKKRQVASLGSASILYVCEPIGEHALLRYGDRRYWGYDEEEALRYFLNNYQSLGMPIERILIRPHPSESVEKYFWVQKEFDLPIEIGGALTLLEEISESDVVVGCESMAMVVALAAGKKVFSCIPPGGRECSLPHKDIAMLRDVLKIKRGSQDES